MHLADSALPAGGYAFSNGLEGAYQLGLLDASGALEEFVHTALMARGLRRDSFYPFLLC